MPPDPARKKKPQTHSWLPCSANGSCRGGVALITADKATAAIIIGADFVAGDAHFGAAGGLAAPLACSE